jgi:CheY-like chemotaxis protein
MTSSRPLVLYVENNPGDIALMLKAFDDVGSKIDVLTAADGRAAITYLESTVSSRFRLPRLLMIDMILPEFSGFDLVSAIKTNKTWRGIPIIVVTVSPTDEDRERAKALGVDAFLPKPQSWHRYLELALNVANFVLLE